MNDMNRFSLKESNKHKIKIGPFDRLSSTALIRKRIILRHFNRSLTVVTIFNYFHIHKRITNGFIMKKHSVLILCTVKEFFKASDIRIRSQNQL